MLYRSVQNILITYLYHILLLIVDQF